MSDAKKAAPAAKPMEAEFELFAAGDAEDARNMKIAWMLGIFLFGVILVVAFPSIQFAAEDQQKKQKVYVVQQVRFKPPPPQQQQEIPKPKSKKVPIPDPTPDEPEPIRLVDEIEPDVQLPTDDFLFGIPDAPPEKVPDGPIRVGGDVKAPNKISAPNPQYTEIARKARISGVVIVEAIIDKTGNVTNVKVLKGLPMGLDQAAADAVKKWKFEPATLNGKPVSVIYNLTVNFQLQ